MSQLNILQPVAISPAILYYGIALVIFIILYLGKLKINTTRKYFLFVIYTFFVIAMSAIQINIFANGASFVKGFLHVDIDIDQYDSIYWGALCFSILYLLAMPKNNF